jgi:replicative superfamily II helicase
MDAEVLKVINDLEERIKMLEEDRDMTKIILDNIIKTYQNTQSSMDNIIKLLESMEKTTTTLLKTIEILDARIDLNEKVRSEK